MFRKAAEFKGRPRFRMVAIGEAAETFVRDFPDYFIMFEEIIQLPSVREKTSEKRQAVVQNCEMQCMFLQIFFDKKVTQRQLFWRLPLAVAAVFCSIGLS